MDSNNRNVNVKDKYTNSRISKWLFSVNIQILTTIPGIFGSILLLYSERISNAIPLDYSNIDEGSFLRGLGGFLIGLIGVIHIIRREMPGRLFFNSVHGWWPVFMGALLVIFFWGASALMFYFAFTNN